MKFTVTVDGAEYENCVVFPYNYEDALDATLDQAALTIQRIPKDIIEPLTDITVTVTDGDGNEFSHDWIVSDDDSYEAPVGSGLYTHTLQLIELTKYGEGFIGDSLCVTFPGGNVYTENAKPVEPEET